jgi:hypothetical protein
MTDPTEHARFVTATRQWRTLVEIQLVHGELTPDESKSGTEIDLYVFRDRAGQALLKFTLEAPSGWSLIWDIGQGGSKGLATPGPRH